VQLTPLHSEAEEKASVPISEKKIVTLCAKRVKDVRAVCLVDVQGICRDMMQPTILYAQLQPKKNIWRRQNHETSGHSY